MEVRSFLLGYRSFGGEVPEELRTIAVVDIFASSATPAEPASLSSPTPILREELFGSNFAASPQIDAVPSRSRAARDRGPRCRADNRAAEKPSLPTASENAYKVLSRSAVIASREEELKRSVQSKLNKICPDNVDRIVEQLGSISLSSTDELSMMIGLIFKKALTEPHYCETYADLVFSLKARLPEFSAPDGGKPVTFKAALLNTVQEEYEALPKVLEPTEEERAQFPEPAELQLEVKKRKDRFIANMKFIGHLFLRHLLSAKVISSVLRDLTTCDALDDTPHEHKIECVIELLESIGYTLESMPTGQQALAQVYGRLLELKKQKSASGRCFLSKRLQFRVQDLLDMRSAGWTKKVFKAQAKTKEDIRLDQEHGLDVAARIVAGARPEYVAASKLR